MITTRLSVPRPPRVAPLILFIIGLSLAARITSPHNILNGKLAEEGEEGNFDQEPGHCFLPSTICVLINLKIDQFSGP